MAEGRGQALCCICWPTVDLCHSSLLTFIFFRDTPLSMRCFIGFRRWNPCVSFNSLNTFHLTVVVRWEGEKGSRDFRSATLLVTAVFSVLHVPLVVCRLLINALARCPVGRCHRLKHRKSVTSFKLVADYATNPKP